MDGELVVPGGLDDADLGRVEDEADRGDEERGGDALAVEEVDDAGERDAGAELPLREPPDRGVAVAQAVDGLVVDVEGEEDGHARAAGPAFGLEAAACADSVDGFQNLLVGPLPAGDVVGGGGGGGGLAG